LKYKTSKLTLEERRARIQAKIEAFKASGGEVAAEDDDDE
jgi:large subunit ribosomal protein L5e